MTIKDELHEVTMKAAKHLFPAEYAEMERKKNLMEDLSEFVNSRTMPRPGLGPKQIEWCRLHIPHFKDGHDKAEAAREDSDHVRALMENKGDRNEAF